MHIKHFLDDFRVEERIHFPGEQGAYDYYQVEKRDADLTTVREAMAEKLGVRPSAVTFPAPRDISAVTVQYASVRKHGPIRFQGQGFVARCVQQGPRALKLKDLKGNRFNIMVRHLSKSESQNFGQILSQTLALGGLPNYFDDQRFASLTQRGFIGKAILMQDAEEAVRMYLSESMRGDSEEMLAFKTLVKTHWGQWGYLLHQAPRPSNLRSVVTYLKDHPHDYDKAVNLIQDQLLNFFLLAYQSWIWNRILAQYLQRNAEELLFVEIAGTKFPLPKSENVLEKLQTLVIELPRLTTQYPGELSDIAKNVLEEEGVTQADFNVRLLRRVCLTKCSRLTWFAPIDVEVGAPVIDENSPDHWAIPVSFSLPLGHYATLVLKAVAAHLGTTIKEIPEK